MATPLGIKFFIDEKTVEQDDLKLLGSNIELLVIEFDQEKFEQLLFSDSISPKALWKYDRVSSETHF